ncbi:MAG: transposase [Anaerolineales bacterium]|nr:transposase [Anaerolineales bacterium]MCB9430996.1 transposase [Ardenticatenaceae bacterium]MCA9995927.1 transposase [Anaerolineales bacterium]MCB9432498.1 transposase [Ardenticatenaceae bacterium]MCB9433514.1 transposase [Ardenticatenaceae bacterium]
METNHPFSQLQLQFIDPIQHDYEVIRPIILFSQPVAERSHETETPRSTVSDKARRFVIGGMLGLVDKRSQTSQQQEVGYPDPIANHILYLKQLYPPIHYREIVRIIENKFGHKTNHNKVKRFLTGNPVPVQLEIPFVTFHDFDDAYEARWTVVRMFYEGWNKKSIANLLKLSRQHVTDLIQAFAKDGFAALEDKRTRPTNHPDNQMTLPFMEQVFKAQLEYPDLGRFRLHGVLEQEMGEDTPSETTVGRAMNHNRLWLGAPHPLKQEAEKKEPAELPYEPRYHHQYWFIDIRYLVKQEGNWVYSVCIIEGMSRAILAGMASHYQDELVILQLLHTAVSHYGRPWGIVSDNGSVFTADAFLRVLDDLEIQPCPIEKRQAWQNLIEAQFNVQRRLADAKFKQSETFAEIQTQHAAFIQVFNTTRHWAHRQRTDDCLTPISVLGGRLGRAVTASQLRQAFRQLQVSRVVNQHGAVSLQRFYLYAERGLTKQPVTVWIYEDRLNIEYKQTLLARYECTVARKQNKITAVTDPKLYDTPFRSPQQELLVLDDEQWLKVLERPPYHPRQPQRSPEATQLFLWGAALTLFLWLFWL